MKEAALLVLEYNKNFSEVSSLPLPTKKLQKSISVPQFRYNFVKVLLILVQKMYRGTVFYSLLGT